MQESAPSRTAMRVAMRRAAHQLLDSPLVLADPLAVPIIGPEAVARIDATRHKQRRLTARAARAFMAVRSRFAEDELARAVGRGVAQYVVLGAGLDTFAYRSPFPGLRVFEVDHPATQAWKRRKLARAHIDPPPSMTFVPVDFERETAGARLSASGFDPEAPAFFAWLGVTMYLTGEAIASTLRFIAATPATGGLALDYLAPVSLTDWRTRIALWWLSRKVAAAGEPFRTLFSPAALHDQLTRLGFTSIVDLGRSELNARYFAGRSDRLRISGTAGRVLSAEL